MAGMRRTPSSCSGQTVHGIAEAIAVADMLSGFLETTRATTKEKRTDPLLLKTVALDAAELVRPTV